MEERNSAGQSAGRNEGGRGALKIVAIAAAIVAFFVFSYREVLFAPSEWTRYRPGQVVLPDAVLVDIEEKSVPLSKLLSDSADLYVLSFWATWCQPCLEEIPILLRVSPELEKQGIKVVLVNYDSPSQALSIPQVRAWKISQKLDVVTYFDFNEQLMRPLAPPGFPFAVGIKRDRGVVWTKSGFLDWEHPSEVVQRFRR